MEYPLSDLSHWILDPLNQDTELNASTSSQLEQQKDTNTFIFDQEDLNTSATDQHEQQGDFDSYTHEQLASKSP